MRFVWLFEQTYFPFGDRRAQGLQQLATLLTGGSSVSDSSGSSGGESALPALTSPATVGQLWTALGEFARRKVAVKGDPPELYAFVAESIAKQQQQAKAS